jgi:hypothetical protein
VCRFWIALIQENRRIAQFPERSEDDRLILWKSGVPVKDIRICAHARRRSKSTSLRGSKTKPHDNVLVSMPSASTQEVAQRVTSPMECLLNEIPAVEYIYSTSQPGSALVPLRWAAFVTSLDCTLPLQLAPNKEGEPQRLPFLVPKLQPA